MQSGPGSCRHENWSPRHDLHAHWSGSEPDASTVGLRGGWSPQKELHLHAPLRTGRCSSVTSCGENGATPGTCALLCRLRIGCIAVFACAAKGHPHGGIRTRTCPILSRMPLLLGYMGKNGGRRRTCSPGRFPGPISLAMSPGSLVRFTFQNWSPRKELHPDDEVRSLECCLLHHAERNGAPPRTRTG